MKLLRKDRSNPKFTEGKLVYPDDSYTYTLERAWKNNEPFISCIPNGIYKVLPDFTGRFKYFKVDNVQNRSDIEFHAVAHYNQLQGCIAPCERVTSEGYAIGCENALQKLLEWFTNEDGSRNGFVLEIRDWTELDGEW